MAVTTSPEITVKTEPLDPEDSDRQDSTGDSLKNAGGFPSLVATTKIKSAENNQAQMFIHLELAETGEQDKQGDAAYNTVDYDEDVPDSEQFGASNHDGHTSIEEEAFTNSSNNRMEEEVKVECGLEMQRTVDDKGCYSEDPNALAMDCFVQASIGDDDSAYTVNVRNKRKNMSTEEQAALRAKHAEMMQRVRAGWSEEEKAARRAKHAERMRRARAAWSEEKKAAKRTEHAERMRRMRAGLSPAESPCAVMGAVNHDGCTDSEDSRNAREVKVEPGLEVKTNDVQGCYNNNLTALSAQCIVQPPIAGNEILALRAQKLRRARRAEQMRLRRAKMSKEQQEAIRAHEREAQRKRRAEMSDAKREKTKALQAEKMRQLRAAWTEEQKAARRAQDSERMRRLRASRLLGESDANSKAIRAHHQETTHKCRAEMTDEQCVAVKLTTQIKEAQSSEEERSAAYGQKHLQDAKCAKMFKCSYCDASFTTYSIWPHTRDKHPEHLVTVPL